jgi:hypothetical protein
MAVLNRLTTEYLLHHWIARWQKIQQKLRAVGLAMGRWALVRSIARMLSSRALMVVGLVLLRTC